MTAKLPTQARRRLALTLVVLLCHLPATAGVIIHRGTQGLTMTGTDGVYYDDPAGLTMTGTDGLLGFSANGVSFGNSADGLTMTGTDGLTMTGTDGVNYTGANGYTATHVSGLTMTGTDGLTMTGTDGLTMTGTDGTVYRANAVTVRQANGLTMTGTDGLTMTGTDGLTMTGTDSLTMVSADGMTAERAESVRIDSAAQVVAIAPDGSIFYAPTNGLTMTGVDGLTMTGTDGVSMHGVQGLTMTGTDGLTMTGTDGAPGGLAGFDPELALTLNKLTIENLTDDSNVNAVFVYHRAVSNADIADLQQLGINGGTRFRMLPMVVATATANQIAAVSRLPAVRSIYGNRTLQWNAEDGRSLTRIARVRADADLTRQNGGMPLNGNGVGVAVIDTGIDATHPDLAGRVFKNVKLADLQGANPAGFTAPANIEDLQNTDLLSGHGTFVAGVIGGNGSSSTGKHAGYAPGARLVGLSAGDVSLFHVLAGFDYLLSRPDLDVRVVNCSFSANTVYSEHDPVNVATRLLTERGVNIVFSAGNSGSGLRTLNPYAAAPWVISVGATDARGRLAGFSARGDFGSRTLRPTLVAPGVDVVSLRASGANQTGAGGIAGGNDAATLNSSELPYYTTASGTSFSAPQVAGAIALMLQVNPRLKPAEVRDILQRTATPLPPYYAHEVGAGMLNAHAAALEAAFPQRRIGLFRAAPNREQVKFVKEPAQEFSGTAQPGSAFELSMSVPNDAVYAATQIAWGPLWSVNDLSLAVYDPSGVKRAESNFINLPGLTGKRERTLLSAPASGAWRVRVSNTLGVAGTPQEFKGAFEVARVEYAALKDLEGLNSQTTEAVRYALRTFSMSPYGSRFQPTRGVTRAEMCAALVAGARLPLYVPARPSYTDVNDATTMNFIESVQSAPAGALFHDAQPGSRFRPDESVSRLLAAIVLVRAAGLQAEAESSGAARILFTDRLTIPAEWRGYVDVAVSHGLLSSDAAFNPNADFTRADLARALVSITRMWSE